MARPNPTLNELVHAAPAEAINICRAISAQLTTMQTELAEANIDLDQSIPSLNAELQWYNWSTRRKLKLFEQRFYSILQRLSTLSDETTSILVCSGNQQAWSGPLRFAREMKMGLKAEWRNAALADLRSMDA